MNVSIFLRQFGACGAVRDGAAAAVVDWLRDGDSSRQLGAERLRALLRIMPDTHELQLLQPYHDKHSTDSNRLAAAERFYLQLISLPKYRYFGREISWR